MFNEDAPVKHINSSISWRFSALCRSSHPAEGLVVCSFFLGGGGGEGEVVEIIYPLDCITRLHFHITAIESAEQDFL